MVDAECAKRAFVCQYHTWRDAPHRWCGLRRNEKLQGVFRSTSRAFLTTQSAVFPLKQTSSSGFRRAIRARVRVNRQITEGPHVPTTRSLYLCRTPFQLLMCQRIVALSREKTADLCYMTSSNSEKDRYYVDRAEPEFDRIEYRVLGPKLDIAAFIYHLPRHWIGTTRYDRIYLANHTLSHFRYLIKHHSMDEVCTYDEGSGNFDPEGALRVDNRSGIERLRDRILGIPPVSDIFEHSQQHYTVNADLTNVVDRSRLQEIALVDVPDAKIAGQGTLNLVMGQPFEEVLNRAEQSRLLNAISALRHGHYIMHPREPDRSSLIPKLDVIQDRRIIEDYICGLVAEGFRVRLIGPFSTTFFTINSPMVEKYYLHASSRRTHPDLAAEVGCDVFDLHDAADRERWGSLVHSWEPDAAA